MSTDETFFSPSDLFEEPDSETLERIEGLTRSLLEALGEDTDRPGLERTPERVARSWRFLTSGYGTDLREVVNGALFPAESPGLVVVRDISFASLCEHHLLPFFGSVHIGYVPDEQILGLSKLARITDVFARRLQVQERLTGQIAEAIMGLVEPFGVGVVVDAEHMCMRMRGVEKPGAVTRTTALLGSFGDDPAIRDELFAAIRDQR
jgi:GTP cyclohydrolase I